MSSAPLEPVLLKTPQQVSEWLAHYNLSQFDAKFQFHKLTADVLLELSDADLRTIGIERIGDRKRILRAINHLIQRTYFSEQVKLERQQQLLLAQDINESTRTDIRLIEKVLDDQKLQGEYKCQEIARLQSQIDCLMQTRMEKRKLAEVTFRANSMRMMEMQEQSRMLREMKEKLLKVTESMKHKLADLDAVAKALEQRLQAQ